ncbi:MAG: hypothetical protein KDH09_15510 [Chrysiogenetes bacterium]|nr:hypothetical protein [Chrysiogenetes bacterium]
MSPSPIRTFLLALVLILATGTAALARGSGREQSRRGPPEQGERADRMIERLSDKLDLTEAQQSVLREEMEKVGPLMGQSMDLRHELRGVLLFEGETERAREIRSEIQGLDDQIYSAQVGFGEKLRSTLSAQQFEEFKQLHAQREERRDERREDRRERRSERQHDRSDDD